MSEEVMDLDSIKPIAIKVKYQGKTYVLREASEDIACAYQNALVRGSKVESVGNTSSRSHTIGAIADAEPILVAGCLFEQYEVRGEVKERPVPLQVIRSWPSRVVKPLFDKAKEISHIDPKKEVGSNGKSQEDYAKNLPSAIAATSA